MEIKIDIDRNRERRRLRPRQLYTYSLLPPLQALREGGVEGAVEGLAPTERRLPPSEWLVGFWALIEKNDAKQSIQILNRILSLLYKNF